MINLENIAKLLRAGKHATRIQDVQNDAQTPHVDFLAIAFVLIRFGVQNDLGRCEAETH